MDQEIPDRFEAQRAQFDSLDRVWLDGEVVDWDEATVHVLTHALHYGTSVFEGVRCYDTADGPALFRWGDHLDRFFESAAVYDMPIGYDREELTAAARTLIREQDLGSCYVRPVAFYGYDRLGINPTTPTEIPTRVAMACWPWGAYLGDDALERGIDVGVSSWRKYDSEAVPATAKTGGAYVNNVLASQEAARNGYDEAVLLNSEGTVAEGPGENLFLVRDGEIHTPGLAADVLDGVTRRTAVRLARDLGYAVYDDATVSRGELYTADELFFTGTAAEVTPIRTVDGVTVGDGEKGPVTDAVQSRFFEVLEERPPEYEDWFTDVDPQEAETRRAETSAAD